MSSNRVNVGERETYFDFMFDFEESIKERQREPNENTCGELSTPKKVIVA